MMRDSRLPALKRWWTAGAVAAVVSGAALALTPLGPARPSAAASPPPPSPSVSVSPAVWISGTDGATDGPSSMKVCGNRDPGSSNQTCAAAAAQPDSSFEPNWSSQQRWATAAGLHPQWTQAGFGINDGPQDANAQLGASFVLADFSHWNPGTRGDTPTVMAVHGNVVVHPPAGAPVTVPLQRHPSIAGHPNGFWLRFLETDNVPPCDPLIQRSDTPCDDAVQLSAEGVSNPAPFGSQQDIVSTTEADGVRWQLRVLGWDDGNGGITQLLSTEEEKATERKLYGQLSVDISTTTTTLTADRTSTAVGDPITLTATVSPAPGTGGTVAFRNGDTMIAGCTAAPVDIATGIATCTTSGLPAGAHAVTAAFSSAIGFAASTSAPVAVTVNSAAAATVTTLTAVPQRAQLGRPVTFTAHVEPQSAKTSLTPTGEVRFYLNDASAPIATEPLDSDGTASFTTTRLPAAANLMRAEYSGDARFEPSTTNAAAVTITGPGAATPPSGSGSSSSPPPGTSNPTAPDNTGEGGAANQTGSLANTGVRGATLTQLAAIALTSGLVLLMIGRPRRSRRH